MISHRPDTSALPNFLVIGAGKAGTTSLHHYLRQHPDIYMSPIKETNFFAYDPGGVHPWIQSDASLFPVTAMEDYKRLFRRGRHKLARGEVSPMYLWHPAAPGNIHAHLPDATLIAILRNPVERAYSSYMMKVSQNRERRTFAKAVEEETLLADRMGGWPAGRDFYIGLGFYYRQLTNYTRLFRRDQMNIFLYEEFKENPVGVLRQIWSALGLRAAQVPEFPAVHNPSGLPKNRFIHFLLQPRRLTKRIRRHLPSKIHDPLFDLLMGIKARNLVKPPLEPAPRSRLLEIFREDIVQLQSLLGRDLLDWLKEKP